MVLNAVLLFRAPSLTVHETVRGSEDDPGLPLVAALGIAEEEEDEEPHDERAHGPAGPPEKEEQPVQQRGVCRLLIHLFPDNPHPITIR